MKRGWMYVIVLGLLVTSGCATRGRFAIFDLDLRDKEQIDAYKTEATCIYESSANQLALGVPVKEEPAAVSPWYQFMFDFLKIMKGRIRILSVEWQK